MRLIGVTGPRSIGYSQRQAVRQDCRKLLANCGEITLYTGDATGVDAVARQVARATGVAVLLFERRGAQRWHFQERSKRMVEALALGRGTLHAWPNKPAPAGITPQRWQGSGTWGSIRYAVALGVPVELHPLAELGELPEWLRGGQMSML